MKTISQIISVIFHPIFIPLYLAVIFVNSLPFALLYSSAYKIVILGTIAIFTCIIPIFCMFFQYLTGSISNFYIEERKKRTPIYALSLISCIICVFCLVYLRIEPFFLFIFVSSLIAVLVLAVVNLKWKISAHGCGAGVLCGAIFAFAYYLSANSVLLFCAVIFIAGTIMTSRLALKAHTLWQVAAGFLVGLLFSVLPMFF